MSIYIKIVTGDPLHLNHGYIKILSYIRNLKFMERSQCKVSRGQNLTTPSSQKVNTHYNNQIGKHSQKV